MSAMASQITSLTIVYSIVYSGADQRKHQSSASLAFVRGIHRWPVNSPHKGSVTRKLVLFDNVMMNKFVTAELIQTLATTNNNSHKIRKITTTMLVIQTVLRWTIILILEPYHSMHWCKPQHLTHEKGGDSTFFCLQVSLVSKLGARTPFQYNIRSLILRAHKVSRDRCLKVFQSLWNFIGVSTALLPQRLSKFKAFR